MTYEAQAKRIEELEALCHRHMLRKNALYLEIETRQHEIKRLRKALEQAISHFSGEYIHTSGGYNLNMNEAWVMEHLRAALGAAPPVAEPPEKVARERDEANRKLDRVLRWMHKHDDQAKRIAEMEADLEVANEASQFYNSKATDAIVLLRNREARIKELEAENARLAQTGR